MTKEKKYFKKSHIHQDKKKEEKKRGTAKPKQTPQQMYNNIYRWI